MDKRPRRGYIRREMALRLGLAELFTAASILVVAVLVTLALTTDWTIAVVPGLTYALAIVAAYAVYRQHTREKAAAAVLEQPVRFRVVDSRGVCPFGYRKGDFVTVTVGSLVVPQLCPPAEAVLRLAAEADQPQDWCCPVYEHLLVFRREPLAA